MAPEEIATKNINVVKLKILPNYEHRKKIMYAIILLPKSCFTAIMYILHTTFP